MTKGTSSMGKHSGGHSHAICPRCNARSFHLQKKRCAKCGYPSAKIRGYNWSMKALRRKSTGTGRMRALKQVNRMFKNGFRHGTVPVERKKNRSA